jgi:beta-alanine--pyruvate transaminase
VLCFEKGVLTRYTGDILAFSPPLIIEEAQIDEIVQSREIWKKVEPILLGNRGCY